MCSWKKHILLPHTHRQTSAVNKRNSACNVIFSSCSKINVIMQWTQTVYGTKCVVMSRSIIVQEMHVCRWVIYIYSSRRCWSHAFHSSNILRMWLMVCDHHYWLYYTCASNCMRYPWELMVWRLYCQEGKGHEAMNIWMWYNSISFDKDMELSCFYFSLLFSLKLVRSIIIYSRHAASMLSELYSHSGMCKYCIYT